MYKQLTESFAGFRIQRKWNLRLGRETSANGDAELGQCKKDEAKSRNDWDPFIHPCVKNFNRNAAHVILRTSQILLLLRVFEPPTTISPWESEVAERPEIMEACHLTLSLQPHLCQIRVCLLLLLFFSPLPWAIASKSFLWRDHCFNSIAVKAGQRSCVSDFGNYHPSSCLG